MEKLLEHALDLKWFSGFLSANPEVRYFESGGCLCTMSVALKKNKDDETTWLNCEAWGNGAEELSETFKKGDKVLVCGTFKKTEYNNKTYYKLQICKCYPA